MGNNAKWGKACMVRLSYRPGMAIIAAVGVLFLLYALTGCGKSNQEAIIGTWGVNGTNQTMEFEENGTVRVSDLESGQIITGTYTFLDDTQVEMNVPGAFELPVVVIEVDIRFNDMAITGVFSEHGGLSGLGLTRKNP